MEVAETPLRCAACGQQLDEGSMICAACDASEAGAPPSQHEEVMTAVRSAQGLALFGAVFVPWLLQILAFRKALEAARLYRKLGLVDPPLQAKIRLVTYLSGSLAVAFYAGTILLILSV